MSEKSVPEKLTSSADKLQTNKYKVMDDAFYYLEKMNTLIRNKIDNGEMDNEKLWRIMWEFREMIKSISKFVETPVQNPGRPVVANFNIIQGEIQDAGRRKELHDSARSTLIELRKIGSGKHKSAVPSG